MGNRRDRQLTGLGVFFGLLLAPAVAMAGLCETGFTCDCLVTTPYVPTGAAWATTNNPSFENGFTGGVANNWTAGYQSFSSNPAYSDSTVRATQGTHSQLITVPQMNNPFVNQRAGLLQQIYVVPGQTYTLSADVYMELDVGEGYAGEKFVAQVGLDPYGDTDIGEGSVTWSDMYGSKYQWHTITVSTTAVFEVMTVYVSSMQKYVTPGNGKLYIDHIVISGPVPTVQPSPPETGWIDPDLSIPTTTGGERVANNSFEGSWSNGLAASWNSWSTAGTGYWRQSTLVGKLGGGHYDNSEVDSIVAMNAKTVLSLTLGNADYWGTKPNMVDTIVVGRIYIDDYVSQYLSNPTYYGGVHADNCWTQQQNHPRIDCWEGMNEPGWQDPANWANVIAFEKAFTERCHFHGMKSIVLDLSIGSPGNIWKMLDCHDLLAEADYVGYHTGGGTADKLIVSAPNPVDAPCSFWLRWRQYVDMYRDRGWRMPPAIYTECATWGGWHGVYSPDTIRNDLIGYGAYLNEDRWNLGLCWFVVGGDGGWDNYDLQGQNTSTGTICSDVGAWNLNHPTEATDGLYSQEFGAGSVHPTTLSDMQNPTGNFTGGIVQQVTGLGASNTYLLDLDFRYEFRGNQPQVTFYTGVDLTGQTSDPNAGTINWSLDLISSEGARNDVWERTWRTFQATGTTASVWLKGAQTVSNPAYRISVDRVSVKQVNGNPVPEISRTPASLSPSCNQGTNAASQTFTVQNTGAATLNYSISDDATWLSCSPASGTSTGEADTITVTYATSGLSAGAYNATITISDPNATNNPQTIAVTLTVQTCSNGTVSNGGFETGSASPWVAYGTTDGVVNSGQDGVTAHGGSKMFGARANSATKNGGAYQQISVCSGASCSASAWIYTSEVGGQVYDVNCRIGIDPAGGTDSNSANIVWAAWTNSNNAWSQITQSNVTAQGSTVTVFIGHQQKWNLQFNFTMLDDVTFTASGCTPPATPGAPTVNGATTTTLNVADNATDSGTAYFAIRINGGGYSNQYVQADGSVGASAVWQTKATWVTKTVTGLVTSTTYTFDLKAANDGSGTCPTGFGTAAQGTTACTPPGTPGAPTVNGATSTTLNVANNAGDSGTAYFVIRVNGGSYTNQYVQANGTVGASGVWQTKATWGTKTVTGLAASTTYTFDLIAANDASGTCPSAYGTSAQGTTACAPPATPGAPTVNGATTTTLNVANNAGDSGTAYFAIRINGGSYSNQYVQANGSVGASAVWQTKATWGTKTVTGLAASTTYTFDLKAGNDGSGTCPTGFGTSAQGTTTCSPPATPGAPTVNGATSSSLNVANNAGDSGTAYFAIRINGGSYSNQYVQANGSVSASAVWQTKATWGTKTVTGLAAGTTYTFDLKAGNDASGTCPTGFGTSAQGTTTCSPPATPGAPTVNGATSSSLNVANNAGDSGTAYFAIRINGGSYSNQYVQANGSVGASAVWQTKATWGTKTVTGLAASTTYTFDLKAANDGSGTCPTGFGTTAQGTTTCSPPATPGAPTVNGATTTTLNVANNAGDSGTAYFAIRINGGSYSNQYVQANGSVGASAVWQTKATWGTKTVTGLAASTTYTFDLKAANDASGTCPTGFGTSAQGTTTCSPPATPGAPTVNGATTSSLNVASNAGDSGTAYFAIRINGGSYSNQYVQANGSVGASAVWQTKATWGTKAVTGLAGSTTYTFDLKAANDASGTCPTGFGTSTQGTTLLTGAEDFTSMPGWTSSYDAGWGNAATWSIVSGGQSGNALQAVRSNTGSSSKVKVYSLSTNTSYTISVWMKCPSSTSAYWDECAYKLGSYTAQDYDQNAGTWTLVQKFTNTGTNGNGNTWTQYSATFNSGSNTQISVGFKLGSTSGNGPTVLWDTLRIQ